MEHPLRKKTSLIMFGLLFAGATANNLRNTATGAYSDPYCNTFSPDGTCCLKCSDHYFKNSNGRCQAVSDFCKTWDECTGLCTSCFDGYGVPHNGVCSNIPVGQNCSEEVSQQRPSDCESRERNVDRWGNKVGRRNRRNNSRNSRKSRRSRHSRNSRECSEQRSKNSCEQSNSRPEHVGKWGKFDHQTYKHSVNYGHKFGGRYADRWGYKNERASRWFSKKIGHHVKDKFEDCQESQTTNYQRENSCSKKSVRSHSKSGRSGSKNSHSHSKKSNRSCSKSVRSLSRKSHYSKKNKCESPSKKSNRSISRKSNCSKKSKHSERKSKHSERKTRFQGPSKKIELKSRKEIFSQKKLGSDKRISIKKVVQVTKTIEGAPKKC